MTDGFGSITWWGFSPCLDFQGKDVNSLFESLSIKDDSIDEINILLVGAGDCRHILNTMAWAHRHPHCKINFYVVENNLELYARDLLLLCLALESQDRIGLQEKTELFLELYGNTLIREQSLQYLNKMSNLFIKMVTDFDYLEKVFPLVDMSLLKYKERDMLEGIFKFWRDPNTSTFDVSKMWDLRLRQHLKARYDSIPNVFDWDYSMKLSDKGAGIITSRVYARWRHTGIAFDLREGTYETPNKSLASGMVFNNDGERVARRGYWGDIMVSPFITFGIESDNQELFKKSNEMYTHSSQHVSEYNMLAMLYELTNKSKYVPPKPADVTQEKGPTLTEITEEDEEVEESNKEQATSVEEMSSNVMDKEFNPHKVENFKVYFMPLQSLPELHKKSKYNKLFHTVYLANSMVHQLNQDLASTLNDKASLIIESAKFMLSIQKEQVEEYVKKVTSMAQGVGCKAQGKVDAAQDNFLRFTFQRQASS